VHEIGSREERLTAIANEYVKDPQATLVVSPDNQSRQDLNDVIHHAMQREGHVDHHEHQISVLVPRQEITGADRQWAERHEEGDVVRYSRGSKALGIEAGDYARVERVDAKANEVTVRTDDDRALSYDPRRLQGVTLYREGERDFAQGDRVQMTAPDRERGVPNRELGTIERIDRNGHMDVRWTPIEPPRWRKATDAISITATPLQATAARDRPPGACSCMSRRTARAKSW
jgi:hypothetical protein